MKNVITLFALFLLFLQAIPAQNTRKEDFFGGYRITDFRPTPEGGFLVTGFVQRDSVQVRRYDSHLELIFTQNISTWGAMFYPNSLTRAQGIAMKDGSIIICVSSWECDVPGKDLVVRLAADGSEILWEMSPEEWGAHDLLVGNDSLFILRNRYSGEIPAVYDLNGNISAGALSGTWLDARLFIGNDSWISAKDGAVTYTDWKGEIMPGSPSWLTPETIHSLDTIPGGGLMARSNDNVYLLTDSLALSATQWIPTDLKTLPIIPASNGYYTLVNNSGNLKFQYRNSQLQVARNFDLGPGISGTYSGTFENVNQTPVYIKNNKVNLGLLHHINTPVEQSWLFQDTVIIEGVWTAPTDATVMDIQVNGMPSGVYQVHYWGPFGTQEYSAHFPEVVVTVSNIGGDTITSCELYYNGGRTCPSNPMCSAIRDITVRRTFSGLSIPPGASMDLDFGDIDVDCSTKDLSELCIVATAINHRRDKNEVNNKFCKNIPNLYVSTQEAPDFQFRLSPNPASDFLHLEVSEDIRAERYQIFAADGKKVQEGVFQADISVNGLSNGLYILVLNDAKGGYGSVRFLLH